MIVGGLHVEQRAADLLGTERVLELGLVLLAVKELIKTHKALL
jgi:hypothetical protein